MSKSKKELSKAENKQITDVKPHLYLGIAPYILTGDKLMLVPVMFEHIHELHAGMLSKPEVMKYVRTGKSYTIDKYIPLHKHRLNENLKWEHKKKTGHLTQFNWTIITHDGIAGSFKISQNEGKTELGFSLLPSQQGRGLARRASELAVEYLSEETSFIATAHPKNFASAKTLESIHYPNGAFVFFRDPKRQNVPKVYGTHQPRDYFVSRTPRQ